MTVDLEDLRQKARSELASVKSADALEGWRLAYLGRRGAVTEVTRGLGEVPVEERRGVGARANQLKTELEEALAEKVLELEHIGNAEIEAGSIDVTLPGKRVPAGRLHPITQTMRDILASLKEMGFQVAEGPEVEWEYYNFEALRIPEHHPARDSQDTFWLDFRKDGRRSMLLRTQTSPMQIRFMETHQPPIRLASPGRVYRYEATDATHEWMITQVELLAVDEGITFRQMKGVPDATGAGAVRARPERALPLRLLSLRGAGRGGGDRVRPLSRGRLPLVRQRGLARDRRRGNGAPRDPRERRL